MSEKIKAIRGDVKRCEDVVTWLEEHWAIDAKHQVEGSCEYKLYFVDPKGDVQCVDEKYEYLFDVEELPRWRAKGDEIYYFVSDWGIVIEKIDEGTYSDVKLYELGNYFQTREEAEKMCKQILGLFKQRQ